MAERSPPQAGQVGARVRTPFALSAHGYAPLYRSNALNHCPGCGGAQWLIGRSTAECAYCATALPLEHTGLEGCALGGIYWDRDMFRHGWHYGPSRPQPEADEWELQWT